MNVLEDPQENYSTGYIKVYRSLFKHWISQRKDYFFAWIWIVSHANYKDNKILINGKLEEVKRGELITSRNSIARAVGMTEDKVRHFLELLENDQMITRKPATKFTKLYICNYDIYQAQSPTEPQQTPSKPPANPQHSPTDNNSKEGKRKKRNIGSKKFTPPTKDEVISFFVENGYKKDIAIQAWNYYEDGNWHDSNDKPVKRWKQKMRGVWFKPENKIAPKRPTKLAI